MSPEVSPQTGLGGEVFFSQSELDWVKVNKRAALHETDFPEGQPVLNASPTIQTGPFPPLKTFPLGRERPPN